MRHWREAALLGLVELAGCTKETAPRTPPTLSEERQPSHARPAARSRADLDPRSMEVLRLAVASKDYATRLIAIEAIADSGAEVLFPWLEECLGDPEHDVRMAAVDALHRFRSPRATALLASVRDDSSEDLDIRALAASALLSATP